MGLCTRPTVDVIEPGYTGDSDSRPSSRQKKERGRKSKKGPEVEKPSDAERKKLNSAPTNTSGGDLGAPAKRDLHSAPPTLKTKELSAKGARDDAALGPIEDSYVAKGNSERPPASPNRPPSSPNPDRLPVAAAARCAPSGPGVFTIEGCDNMAPADVDLYISGILGNNVVAHSLRSAQWADRVHGLKAFDAQLEAFECRAARATEAEARQLFNVAVTILARTLHDKLVPVYLPALSLLVRIYSPVLLNKVDKATSRAAIAHLAPP